MGHGAIEQYLSSAQDCTRRWQHRLSRQTGRAYGSLTASISAYVGYLDATQTIDALAARTRTKGVVTGVAGRIISGGFEAAATVGFDWGDASTRRAVPSATAVSSYRLNTTVVDASASYGFALGRDWSVRPGVGITHVSSLRNATRETGSAAFALDLDRVRLSITFGDASLIVRGGQADAATFRPWALVGARQVLGGDTALANGGFSGGTSRFSVAGASRERTVVLGGVGIDATIGRGVTLNAAYRGEFACSSGHNASVGVSFAF